MSENIFESVRGGNLALVKNLIQSGICSAADKDTSGLGLLYWASYCNKLEIAQFLLENGANPNQMNMAGESPINIAKELGYEEMSSLLMQYI